MRYDVVIIGGGIVGLASALNIKTKKPNARLLIIEKENSIAFHQTGHNSGVIHSGLYYKPGSLKATNCISGYNELLHFCNKNEVNFEICGKVVIATQSNQIAMLHTLYDRGIANGLKGMKMLSPTEIKEIEPHVTGKEGIWVPQTGIIDYKEVSAAYLKNIEALGGTVNLGEKVSSISHLNGVSTVVTQKGSYDTNLVINCGGLYSDKISEFTEDKKIDLRIIPFRGEYYEIKPEKQYLVKNLIYPVPDPNFPFLGVHFTRMINGGIEAGPNAVLAFKKEGYKKTDFDFSEFKNTLAWPGFRKVASKYWKTGLGEYHRSFSKTAFASALQELIPEITAADLIPGGAGVRAQACDIKGNLLDDFSILQNSKAINVCNAPSPAATSSLSIGKKIAEIALERLI